jgi:RNA polymerase sigma factor (sigma-70 family)
MFRRRLQKNDPAIDDLSQRVWAAFWRALAAKRFDRTRAAPSTFLFAIAQNTWVQHLRERGRVAGVIVSQATQQEGVVPGESLSGTEQNPIELAESLQQIRTLLRDPMLANLSETERDVLIAAAQGEPDRALAARLGIAASTVHARRQSACDKVRRYLTGVSHPKAG